MADTDVYVGGYVCPFDIFTESIGQSQGYLMSCPRCVRGVLHCHPYLDATVETRTVPTLRCCILRSPPPLGGVRGVWVDILICETRRHRARGSVWICLMWTASNQRTATEKSTAVIQSTAQHAPSTSPTHPMIESGGVPYRTGSNDKSRLFVGSGLRRIMHLTLLETPCRLRAHHTTPTQDVQLISLARTRHGVCCRESSSLAATEGMDVHFEGQNKTLLRGPCFLCLSLILKIEGRAPRCFRGRA